MLRRDFIKLLTAAVAAAGFDTNRVDLLSAELEAAKDRYTVDGTIIRLSLFTDKFAVVECVCDGAVLYRVTTYKLAEVRFPEIGFTCAGELTVRAVDFNGDPTPVLWRLDWVKDSAPKTRGRGFSSVDELIRCWDESTLNRGTITGMTNI